MMTSRQDTLTTRALINSTFRMLRIKRLNDDTIDGPEIVEASGLLNELLEELSTSGLIIPYLTNITFNLTAGKGQYTLGQQGQVDVETRKIVRLDYAQFISDSTVFKINVFNKTAYYGQGRVQPLQSLPYNVLLQNDTYNSVLTFYPTPERAYQCILNVKQAFDELELDDRLDEIPPHMRKFLRYALARELVEFYGISWTDKQESEYQKLLREAQNAADLDLSINTESDFSPYGAAAVLSGWGY